MNRKKENIMKTNKLVSLAALVMAAAFVLSACGSKDTPTPSAQSVPEKIGSSNSSVIAEGRIVPRDSANLYFMSGGKVDEVLVKEGDVVAKGALLAKLGDRDSFLAGVAAAQVEATAAQQALDTLNRTAGLAYNQAVLDEVLDKEAYYVALKAWDGFDMTKYEDDLDQAKADVADMKKKLDDAKDEFNKYSSLDRNNANRKRAQTDLENAQKNYDDALSKQSDIENTYSQAKSDVDLAKARLDEARRTRENRNDGPDKDQLALVQTRLDAAKAQLLAAQSALDNLDIFAPYAGTIVKVDVSSGETVNPNQVVFVLADTSEWYVETTDLTENEIVDIQKNMDVVVVPDALPDLQLKGTVEAIADTFVEKAGDITYRVRVKLEDVDPRLKWGMTTETRFSEPSK
jgi:multidrug efflux pump subunit AcrA (membrane-fusion protein)